MRNQYNWLLSIQICQTCTFSPDEVQAKLADNTFTILSFNTPNSFPKSFNFPTLYYQTDLTFIKQDPMTVVAIESGESSTGLVNILRYL